MTRAQEELLNYIKKNQSIPNMDEAIDMYTSNSLKTDGRCFITTKSHKMLEYRYSELRDKASSWLKNSIGSLVLQGKIQLNFSDLE